MSAIKALEQWCRIQSDGYRDVSVTNMTTSFRNGLAFCALIHKYRPDLIDFESLRKDDVFENNSLAFRVAEEKLGIPALLDAEDMVALRIPDRLSILTYVSQYYNYFNGRAPSVGGVKRPAEGSKEEPSEKKNLPVTTKNVVSKTSAENHRPPILIAETSPKSAKVAGQKAILVENSNKTGTLNSKCVACKSHVHLVQRHFVEGKLYHRSCFKCSECSSLLLAGAYKAGKQPDTFTCNSHQNRKHPPCGTVTHVRDSSSVGLKSDIRTHAFNPSPSVLSAPVTAVVLKPVGASPAPQPWTTSAQKTQAARQRFFQGAPQAPEASHSNRRHSGNLDVPGKQRLNERDEGQKNMARAVINKKLAGENCNNNNTTQFVIRTAEWRFGDQPGSADIAGWRQAKCITGTAGQQAGHPSFILTRNMESPCNKDSTKPSTCANTADPQHLEAPVNGCLNRKYVKTGPGLRTPDVKDEKPKLQVNSNSKACKTIISSNSHASSKPDGTANPKASPKTNVNSNFKASSDVPLGTIKPTSPQTPEDINSCPSGLNLHITPNPKRPIQGPVSLGSKKGKNVSPAAASRSETRSPSSRKHHIPLDLILNELNEIEDSLSNLEKEGVEMEKKLRTSEEDGDGDILMDPLMVSWFNLIRQKQMHVRRESELVYIAKTQDLEEQQPGVEVELRRLLEKPDHLKSTEERQREERLMERLMEIVNGRNAIINGLDEDRIREGEEDQQLNEMMQNLGVKKSKNKRKSSISKLFRRRSKKVAVE
ncbi:MICAL-like protein 2a [Aplochiton taeniatus]